MSNALIEHTSAVLAAGSTEEQRSCHRVLRIPLAFVHAMANGERASAGKAKLCELASVVLLSAPCAAERLRAQVGFELLHAEIGG